MAPTAKTTLGRLAFWIPSGRLAEFGAAYKKDLAPLLKHRHFQEADTQSPCIEAGLFSHAVALGDFVGDVHLDRQRVTLQEESVFTRTFAFDSPAALNACVQELRQAWADALQDLGKSFSANPVDGLIRHRFALWQTPAGDGQRVEAGLGVRQGLWQSFSIQDGLPESMVSAIFEDSQGRLWFATYEGGVCLFDGAQFTTFTVDDGLPSNFISAIFEDVQSRMWFATAHGVSCYDGKQFLNAGCEDGLVNPHVWAIAQDPQGRLWFATNQGISYKEGPLFETFVPPDSPNPDLITSIVVDREGACWFGRISDQGVGRYLDGQWRGFPELSHSAAKNDMGYVTVDRGGRPWFLFKKGTLCYDGERSNELPTKEGLTSERVSFLVEDRQGRIWCGTPSNGVGYWDGTDWTTFNVQDGLADDQVVCGIQDSRGHLWVGTLGGGVSRYDPHRPETFTTTDGLASNGVMRLLESRNGTSGPPLGTG